jgi:hypothetical protein
MREHALYTGLNAIEGLLNSRGLPPIEEWDPQRIGNSHMRIARDGSWFYRGTRIDRSRMVRLFSTVLSRDEEGVTWLMMPHEKLQVEVDDAPFNAVLLERHTDTDPETLSFTTNVGDVVVADADHSITVHYADPDSDPAPYIRVRGRLDALITRSVFIELGTFARDNGGRLGVESSGCFMPLDRSPA